MPEPEILSLEEVRRWAVAASLPTDEPFKVSREMLARFCATIEVYAMECDRSVEVAGRWQDDAERYEDERDRLSALVGRQREALAQAGIPLEALLASVTWELAPELKQGIQEALEKHVRLVLADRDGERASTELRLLRAWEAAHRKKHAALDLSPHDRLVRGRAIEEAESQADGAWVALEEFREKTLCE